MKFKVGDRVKMVKADIEQGYSWEKDWVGESGVIASVDETERYHPYRIKFDKKPPDALLFDGYLMKRYQLEHEGFTFSKGGLMSTIKKLTNFLKRTLDPHQRNLYQLGWVEVDENELVVTKEGRDAYIDCMVLGKQDFTKYAEAKLKDLKKKEKEEDDE